MRANVANSKGVTMKAFKFLSAMMISLLFAVQCHAGGEVLWKKEYGEEGFQYQCVASAYSESDKSLLIVGMSRRSVDLQYHSHWIWKINETGDKVAEASLDISDSETVQGIISKDNELLIATKTKVISLSSDFKPVYIKDFLNSNKSLSRILRSVDDGYLVTGEDASGIFMLKLESSGSPVWERHFMKDQHSLIVDGAGISEGYGLLANFGNYKDLFYSGESNVWLIQTDINGNFKNEKVFPGRYGSLAVLPQGFGVLYDQSDSQEKRNYRIHSVDANLNEVMNTPVLNTDYKFPDLPERFTIFSHSTGFTVCAVLDEKPLVLLMDKEGKESYRWGSGEEGGSDYRFLSTDSGYFIVSSVYRTNNKEQMNDKIRIIKLLLP